MADDLESLRQRAQAQSNQKGQARQASIEQARKAARDDLEKWKEAIDLAIKQGYTSVHVRPRSGSVTVSSIQTMFGNPKKLYGWSVALDVIWQSEERYKAYGDELQKLLAGHPFHVFAVIWEPDSGAIIPAVDVTWV